MNICDDSHELIAHDGTQCPLCTEIARQDDIRGLVAGCEDHCMDLLDELED